MMSSVRDSFVISIKKDYVMSECAVERVLFFRSNLVTLHIKCKCACNAYNTASAFWVGSVSHPVFANYLTLKKITP